MAQARAVAACARRPADRRADAGRDAHAAGREPDARARQPLDGALPPRGAAPRARMSDTTAIVACFNYGSYLREAVDSLLSQEGGAPHVMVVDDGSTDPETHRAMEAMPAEVELVRQSNAGVVAARNAGLAGVRTPFVLFLDADDRLAPGALAAMRSALEQHPDAGFAYGHHRFF